MSPALLDEDRVEALHDADYLWDYGIELDDFRRVRSALAINELKVFSLKQLASIARVRLKDLQDAGGVEYTEKAGRLNPESLKTLRVFYANRRVKGCISEPLLAMLIRDGNDVLAVHQITGIPLEELK